MSKPPRANQAFVGLVVMGLHLAGVLLWWTADRTLQWVSSGKQPATVAVWLPTLSPSTKSSGATHIPRQPVQDAFGIPRQNSGTRRTPGIATEAPVTDGIPLAPSVLAPADTPSQATPSLNLTLPRKAMGSIAPPSFAEQSPFRGRLPATVERQIAMAAAESGPWIEERVDNDRIRFRRGNTCITMQRPRAAAIDPFNEAMSRMPWKAGLPEECN